MVLPPEEDDLEEEEEEPDDLTEFESLGFWHSQSIVSSDSVWFGNFGGNRRGNQGKAG